MKKAMTLWMFFHEIAIFQTRFIFLKSLILKMRGRRNAIKGRGNSVFCQDREGGIHILPKREGGALGFSCFLMDCISSFYFFHLLKTKQQYWPGCSSFIGSSIIYLSLSKIPIWTHQRQFWLKWPQHTPPTAWGKWPFRCCIFLPASTDKQWATIAPGWVSMPALP